MMFKYLIQQTKEELQEYSESIDMSLFVQKRLDDALDVYLKALNQSVSLLSRRDSLTVLKKVSRGIQR